MHPFPAAFRVLIRAVTADRSKTKPKRATLHKPHAIVIAPRQVAHSAPPTVLIYQPGNTHLPHRTMRSPAVVIASVHQHLHSPRPKTKPINRYSSSTADNSGEATRFVSHNIIHSNKTAWMSNSSTTELHQALYPLLLLPPNPALFAPPPFIWLVCG